ncbi:MAG: 1-acyl-sn-glycerol-3-phosphate acyltransferase [Planctomycetota bacterium]
MKTSTLDPPPAKPVTSKASASRATREPLADPRARRLPRAAALFALFAWAAFGPTSEIAALTRLAAAAACLVTVVLRLPWLAAAWIPDLVCHTMYRAKPSGARHVPARGGALIVANHVSYLDAFFLLSASPRPIRFLVDESFARHPFYGLFLEAAGAIPVRAGASRADRERALAAAAETLSEGGLVAIFAEGSITRTGSLLPFRRGLEWIARRAGAPILPVHLGVRPGSWLTYLSPGRLVRFPRRVLEPVTIAFGAPLAPETSATRVRAAVAAMDGRLSDRAGEPLERGKV